MKTAKMLLSVSALTLAVAMAPVASMGASGEPMVTIFENGKETRLPASQVDEASYIKRGFIKNTAADGSVILELIPKTDVPPSQKKLGSENDPDEVNTKK